MMEQSDVERERFLEREETEEDAAARDQQQARRVDRCNGDGNDNQSMQLAFYFWQAAPGDQEYWSWRGACCAQLPTVGTLEGKV
jgi:hypothetical protein